MNAAYFADVDLIEPSGDVARVVEAIRRMASESTAWEIMESESQDYTRGIDSEGIILRVCNDENDIALAVAERDGSSKVTMYVTNIIPRSGSIPVGEYNAIARRFAADFRATSRKHRFGIKCRLTVEEFPTTLERIIPGKRTRALFQRFIAIGEAFKFAPITHPADLERLDTFICSIHRYRASVHLPALRRWLIAERGWNDHDADWLVQRAMIGCEILRANSRF